MWIVRLALNRPYTFVVLSLLIVIISAVAILQTPTDIFPNIDIPVVAAVWSYTGLPPEEMQNRIGNSFQRSVTQQVNDIEHLDAQAYHGISLVRIFLQPNANVFAGIAQVTSAANSVVRGLPPGITPPNLIQYSATTVPVLSIGLAGNGLSEQQLYDLGSNFLRPRLANIEGASIPPPFGGKQRMVEVDLDPPSSCKRAFPAPMSLMPSIIKI